MEWSNVIFTDKASIWAWIHFRHAWSRRGEPVLQPMLLSYQDRQMWRSLPATYAQNLVESMPKRCQAILVNHEDWTIY